MILPCLNLSCHYFPRPPPPFPRPHPPPRGPGSAPFSRIQGISPSAAWLASGDLDYDHGGREHCHHHYHYDDDDDPHLFVPRQLSSSMTSNTPASWSQESV